MTTTASDAIQRLQRMVDDPAGYFDQARRESEAVVRSELRDPRVRRARSAARTKKSS